MIPAELFATTIPTDASYGEAFALIVCRSDAIANLASRHEWQNVAFLFFAARRVR